MWALKGKRLTHLELARLVHKHGVRGDENIATAIAVSCGEAQRYSEAININDKTHDESYGLWQINMRAGLRAERLEKYNLTAATQLYNPDVNAMVMVDMSAKGTNFKPWGAYTDGKYKANLPAARAAVAELNRELNPPPKKKPTVIVKETTVPLPWISFKQVNSAALGATGVWSTGKDTSKDDVLRVQVALKKVVGLDYSSGPGVFGTKTKAAYKKYQKSLYGDKPEAVDGIPGPDSLTRLGQASNVFQVRDFFETPKKVVTAVKTAVKAITGGRVATPVPGHGVTYAFGVRNSRYAAGYHTGADYAASTGTPVVAVRNGRIIRSDGAGGAYGNWIQLLADNGHVYVYCHLSVRQVSVGATVKAGQQIGKVGATGNVTGPHLHFEESRTSYWSYGNVQNPTW